MRLIVAAVGRLKDGAERELFRRYAARVDPAGRPLGIGPLSIVEIAESRAGAAPARRQAEARGLLAKLPAGATLVALDERGDGLDSAGFAQALAAWRARGTDALAFAVGGPDGLGDAAAARAARRLSLGPMTLPHGLARIVLAEQLYRALTILTGHPYHRS